MTTLAQTLRQLPQSSADGLLMPTIGTGGVMDKLGLQRRGEDTPDRNSLMDYAGRSAALLDHWTMGIPTTVAGLVNSAIPGQPLGDLWSIKDNAETARSDLARSGGADLLALPDAFMGSLGNVPANARPAAQLAPQATRQAGRLADAAIDPIYQAMPSNAVGMFGGKLAKTADTAALAKAEDMAANGVPREQIWSDTGWFQGKDGKWRFEIDDSGAKFDTTKPVGEWNALDNVLSHDAFYDAYPEMRLATVERMDKPGGSYDPHATHIVVGGNAIARSTALHEVQHGAQELEGFARGGSPKIFPPPLPYTRSNLGAPRNQPSAYDQYRRLAGEVESRAVQMRRDMSPDQRRARPPWEDYDVPEDQQIVRFGGNGPQLSQPPTGITAYHGGPMELKGGKPSMEYRDGSGFIHFTDNENFAHDFAYKARGKVHKFELDPGPNGVLSATDGMNNPAGRALVSIGADPGSRTINDAMSSLRSKGVDPLTYVDALKSAGYRVFDRGGGLLGVMSDEAVIGIVKKYGIATAASMYGMDQVSQAMNPDQSSLLPPGAN